MPEVEYYQVLGLEKGASLEEIKDAYRKLAKKYHPDVNTTGKSYEPNSDKFRQIAEAYAVLSIPESKMSYDSTFTERPGAVYAKSKSETMETNRHNRERSGHAPTPKPVRGGYAEYRLKQLEKERKRFNVNHLGYYNGGLPYKRGGNVRGSAVESPGSPHDVTEHNLFVRNDRESHHIDKNEATHFKNNSVMGAEFVNRTRPYYPLETDPEWKYVKARTHATLITLVILGFYIGERIYNRERGRIHRTERMPENLEKAPAHHFVNRGGVLMRKEFLGFSKYFKNDHELTQWYNKVYPDIMKVEQE